MKKSIKIEINNMHFGDEEIRVRMEVRGLGVKAAYFDRTFNRNHFKSDFDLIWEDVGNSIKELYL